MVEDDPLDQLPPEMRNRIDDFYQLFGVEPNASADEIQDSYREMVKQYHPDNSDHDHAESISFTINEAKEVLLDENERLVYNEIGHQNYYRQGKVSDPISKMESDESKEYDPSIYSLISMADLSRASNKTWWRAVIESPGFKITMFTFLLLGLLILLLFSY